MAEAGPQIGTGHLKESLCLAGVLGASGLRAEVWAAGLLPPGLAAGRRPIRRLSSLLPVRLNHWACRMARDGARAVILNLRNIQNPQIAAVRSAGLPVMAFDEYGGKRLAAEIIVNPLLPPQRHRYPGSTGRVFAGPRFLPMDLAYARMTRTRPRWTGDIRSLLISLGGVDRTGATLHVTRLLAGWRNQVRKVLVLGPGFSFRRRLEALLSHFKNSRFELVLAPPTLACLLAETDAVVTAGGNTLCEAACLGVPALVAYEDPHEREQGEAFAKRGFGFCLGPGARLDPSALGMALAALDNPTIRLRHASAGRRLVDGRGAERLARLAKTLAGARLTPSTGKGTMFNP